MPSRAQLFENNKAWAARMTAEDPTFFQRLTRQQNPQYLWIGCSDSRVPANEIVDLLPGELFVHRNVGNVVVHTDLNCLSVLQYAVEVLDVSRIIVCGHYGCGGVTAAFRDKPLGLIDAWLRHIQDVRTKHRSQLDALPDDAARIHRLCELNVIEQARNVCNTSTVRHAWQQGHSVAVMGWIYSLEDGILRDLGFSAAKSEEVDAAYEAAIVPKREGG
ncbi:MAG: carbonate dehydratase [Kiritimatiellae bacterium]|nr:carbonate dehydratase [Kiritimatiellia bacterium]MCO5061786.1 carbonate dehydratase [Kiritimatiellia bacterium]MCO6400413.1 carbonate dehydratase [Verrucomicrobiota bacterium]